MTWSIHIILKIVLLHDELIHHNSTLNIYNNNFHCDCDILMMMYFGLIITHGMRLYYRQLNSRTAELLTIQLLLRIEIVIIV